MAGRPPQRHDRSASIPIPTPSAASGTQGSTTARSGSGNANVDDVLAIPLSISPTTLLGSHRTFTRTPSGSMRTSSTSRSAAVPIPTSSSPTTSRVRTTSTTSATSAGAAGTSPATPVFEPRIVRGSVSRSVDSTSALPSFPSTPAIVRRRSSVSTSAAAGAGAPLARRPSQVGRRASTSLHPPGTPTTPATAPPNNNNANSAPIVFPRPSYLDHSVLRGFLQTDIPPPAPPSLSRVGIATLPPAPDPPPVWQPQIVRRSREFTPGSDSDESSIAEFALAPPAESPSLISAAANPVLHLPTRWSDQDRHTSLSVSRNGRELAWHGPTLHGERDAAAARANFPIPPACGIFYYEVEILSKGAKAYISVGFSASDVRLTRLPGWEKKSWGYHGDDGNSFSAEKTGTPYGPMYGAGDIIGCGIDFTQHRAFFTKNGAPLPMVFDGIGRDFDLFPSVGLRHVDESIRVNFGHEPFKYDIDDHAAQQRSAVWRSILSTRLTLAPPDPPSRENTPAPAGAADPAPKPTLRAEALPEIRCADGLVLKRIPGDVPKTDPQDKAREEDLLRGPLSELVLSYLMHHGYARSARALKRETEARARGDAMDTDATAAPPTTTFDGVGPGMREPEIEVRTRIVQAVTRGDVDGALRETREQHPSVLERHERLMLIKLRCRKFVEMIVDAADALKHQRRLVEKGVVSLGRDAEDEGVVGAMDVDEEEVPKAVVKGKGRDVPLHGAYDSALAEAIAYGRQLRVEFAGDARSEVQTLLTETFCVVAYEDPREIPGEPARVAGQEARSALATELNQAILESQGRPPRPLLERVCRQASGCVVQLGLMGTGAAAFADMRRELLED